MTNTIVFEIIQHPIGSKFPYFVGTTDDIFEACRQAAAHGPAEIAALTRGQFGATVVFSDNPDVYSGRYFTELVRDERLRRGQALGSYSLL